MPLKLITDPAKPHVAAEQHIALRWSGPGNAYKHLAAPRPTRNPPLRDFGATSICLLAG
jgi:hypothetical protein